MSKFEEFKAFTLVLELGISIIISICLLVALGIFIRSKFQIDLVLLFVIIGVAVGIRNAVIILKEYLKSMKNDKKHKNTLDK